MSANGLLVKIAGRATPSAKEAALSLDGSTLTLTPLFEVAGAAEDRAAAAPTQKARWFKAVPKEDLGLAGRHHAWDAAHRLMAQLGSGGALGAGQTLLAVEPDIEQSWEPGDGLAGRPLGLASEGPKGPKDQDPDKGPVGPAPAWHLDDGFSQLKAGRNAAGLGEGVIIAHLDTGYDPKHRTLPQGLDKKHAWNFVDDDPKRRHDATDRTPGGLLRMPGHGTGTLGILAGNKLVGMLPDQINTGDYLGGAPLATIYPFRVANSVLHFWTSSVAQAIDKARELKVDVLSMSMGGIASQAWTDAVNAAYDAGVVMVCAAGNNYEGLPTPNLVYPARYGRVIAACGAMADGKAYHELPGIRMEGNAGPQSRMGSAIAAYTPNIPWPALGTTGNVDLDGGGTSAATPQVAAAAALWLAKHGSAYAKRDWQRAEAARQALFRSATKNSGSLPANKIAEYFGNGVLRAQGCLAITPTQLGSLKRADTDNASFAFWRMLTGLGLAEEPPNASLFALEMTQLALTIPEVRAILPDPEAQNTPLPPAKLRRLHEAILEDSRASASLRRFLEAGRSDRPAVPAQRTQRARASAQLKRRDALKPPATRRLRIFAFDPALMRRHETAALGEVVAEVPWELNHKGEDGLTPGPVGEYLEIVDIDPPSALVYAPVDLDHPYLLANDGLAPSEGSPQFHQQMVYAVAMKTIRHFEIALGRTAMWAERPDWFKEAKKDPQFGFVRRLRIYPHALRQANAYYSPDKVALLFGYFPEPRPGPDSRLPGGMIFTCLSHDIVAHETTHALLDGLHRRYQENTNPDVLAFHEAFADIVAIFQHFTYPEILRHSLAEVRGNLEVSSLLSGLAKQFGEAIGYSHALRDAIGSEDKGLSYFKTFEPHDRGAILVGAVFRAFVTIYKARTADLLRLATGGSGVLQEGALHPDLVNRLADEAAKAAGQVLTICIRALDYCPPVDITFSDYLRALITADADNVAHDRFGYRIAFLEAFRSFDIYPEEVRTLSVDSLVWSPPQTTQSKKALWDREIGLLAWDVASDRLSAYRKSRDNAAKLHGILKAAFAEQPEIADEIGISFGKKDGAAKLEVHSIRPARRVTPDGRIKTDGIVVLTQKREVPVDPENPSLGKFTFRGGCTMVIDPDNTEDPIRYIIVKRINSERRLARQRAYLTGRESSSLRTLYFGEQTAEPFAALHSGV